MFSFAVILCKYRHLSWYDVHLSKKTFIFAENIVLLLKKIMERLNIIYKSALFFTLLLTLPLKVFAEQESDTLSVQRVESVDEEYLAEIEALIAQSEMETAIKTYNKSMLQSEMQFNYYTLAPLLKGFISVYSRHDFVNNHPSVFKKTDYNAADYAVAGAPLAAAWIMKAAGVKSRSTTRRMFTANAFALGLAAGITQGTKHMTKEVRPDLSDEHSFPSGHTALAYVSATVLSREYDHISPWITVGAYSAATATEMLRMRHNAHWLNDLYMGAGIGVVSTHLGYWLADRIYGEEGINKPELTQRNIQRVLKMSGKPSSFAIVASSDLGGTQIESSSLQFSDGMSELGNDSYHVHVSSFTTAGIEGSFYFHPNMAIEAIAQSAMCQGKVYNQTSNVFTGNTLMMYRGSLAFKGSFVIPNSASRFGIRVLGGVRSLRKADFYLTDADAYNPYYNYSITLPKETKFEIGAGINFDALETKSHVVGFNLDYCHAFSKVLPDRILLGTFYKVLF